MFARSNQYQSKKKKKNTVSLWLSRSPAHAQTHKLICPPQGHLELHKLALAASCKLVSRCRSLSSSSLDSPSLWFLYFRSSASPSLSASPAHCYFLILLQPSPSSLTRSPLSSIIALFPLFSFNLHFVFVFWSTSFTPSLHSRPFTDDWSWRFFFSLVSLKPAAVTFLHPFIQPAVKYSSNCFSGLIAAVNELTSSADVQELWKVPRFGKIDAAVWPKQRRQLISWAPRRQWK